MPTHTSSTVKSSIPERFDVFLSYNRHEISEVGRIAALLQSEGLEPWFDDWYLAGGDKFQEKIAQALSASSACACFAGPASLGDWGREELLVAHNRAATDKNFRVFLALLPGVPESFDPNTSTPFLSIRTWVDLRRGVNDEEALYLLKCAITGKAPGRAKGSAPAATADQDVCPYLGLQSFTEEYAQFFYGRDGASNV